MDGTNSFFASYSRRDKAYVEPAVELLRSGSARVFLDDDHIKPGDQWELVLENNLESASTLLVFWSKNSKNSEWVNKEWRTAAEAKKRIIPVLLDHTKLPEELSSYQYIDFRHFRRRSPWVPILSVTSLLTLVSTVLLWVRQPMIAYSNPKGGPERSMLPPWASTEVLTGAALTLLFLLITVIVLACKKRSRSKQAEVLARDIASAIEKS